MDFETEILNECPPKTFDSILKDYIPEIGKHLMTKSRVGPICKRALDSQTSINAEMRDILVDWLLDVDDRFTMKKPETLFMTIWIVDQILDRVTLEKEKLQLLGISAMFIASASSAATCARFSGLLSSRSRSTAPRIWSHTRVSDSLLFSAQMRRCSAQMSTWARGAVRARV